MYLAACLAVVAAVWVGATQAACPETGCFPPVGNIACGRMIYANSTCGDPAKFFEIPLSGTPLVDICNASDPAKSHPASLAIDNDMTTWWQSEEYTFLVTLQLDFGCLMSLESSTLTFRSFRPNRMILEKSSDNGATWIPYQYYAQSCDFAPTFDCEFENLTKGQLGSLPDDSIEAFCLEEYSTSNDPDEFGTVQFLAASRFGDNRFDDQTIKDHLMLTNLRVRFRQLDTQGDDIAGASSDPDILRKYFYGVTEWNVEGHCYCNGHADTCCNTTTAAGNILCWCKCQHYTTGDHCEECLPLYNNKPYQKGNSTHANACEKCECNGHSTSCVYNAAKGHGVCQNCTDNTEGDMCERCIPNFFRDPLNLNNCIDTDPGDRPILYGCDATEVCPCVAFNASECSECNACYEGVRRALHTERQRFYDLMERVTDYARSLPNDTFSQRLASQELLLQMLRDDVDTATMKADDLYDRLVAISSKLDEIRRKLDEIEMLLNMANSTARSAYRMAVQIESLVNETKSKLLEAYELLKTSVEPNVMDAQQAATDMATLAVESGTLAVAAETEATDQEIQAARLNNTASVAYQTAMEAKMKAERAVESQNTDKQTLQRLMMAVANRSLGFDEAKNNVMNATSKVEQAVTGADDVHTRAAEPRPDLGLTELRQRLTAAEQKTSDIRDRLSEITSKFSSVVTDINNAYSQINQLSGRIDAAADRADDLKSRAYRAYRKANDSVASGEMTIAQAQEMLEILTNFSQIIIPTRAKAMAALQQIEEIERLSQNATAAANRILAEHQQAYQDAMMAVQLAGDALQAAMDALARAEEIRDDLVSLKMTGQSVKNYADEAVVNATELNTTATDLLASCTSDRPKVDSVISDAAGAIINQTQCRNKLDASEDDIASLRDDIANIQRLDPYKVMSLRQKIFNLADAIDDADLMNVIRVLQQQRDDEEEEINRCDAMIEELERDVENLKLAVAAGQNGCVGIGPAE